MKQEKKIILLEKIEEMLKNKAITLTQNKPEKFVSSNFIIPNKSSGFRPAINLKNLNVQPLSTTISKWKVYFFMNELLEEWDYICKLNLKDVLFPVSLHKHSKKKNAEFQRKQKLYQFFLPLFQIGLSTQSVYKTHVSPSCYTNKIKCTADSLLRRYSNNCEVSTGTDSSKGCIDFSITKSGLPDKF